MRFNQFPRRIEFLQKRKVSMSPGLYKAPQVSLHPPDIEKDLKPPLCLSGLFCCSAVIVGVSCVDPGVGLDPDGSLPTQHIL